MFLGGILGTWASFFIIGLVVTQTSTGEACSHQGSDRIIALMPAVLSFVGALFVAWWNRPDRKARARSRRRA